MNLYKILRWLGIYRIYETWLKRQIDNKEKPKHIGIILDGNRRWARRKGLNAWDGHKIGASKVKDLLRWCYEIGIKTITLYTFSTENFSRSKEEREKLMSILKEKVMEAINDEELMRRGIKVKFIGDLQLLSKDLVEKMKVLENKTSQNTKMVVNIAVAYGGKHEILMATKRIAEKVYAGEIKPNDITYDLFQNHLYTSHLDHQDVDMVLRTGGEMRLSNFLLWQSAYSELIFLDVYWPDFRKIDLMRAVRTYQNRQRRYGK